MGGFFGDGKATKWLNTQDLFYQAIHSVLGWGAVDVCTSEYYCDSDKFVFFFVFHGKQNIALYRQTAPTNDIREICEL